MSLIEFVELIVTLLCVVAFAVATKVAQRRQEQKRKSQDAESSSLD